MGVPLRAPCVRTLVTVRRVQRHPLTRKTLKTVQRNVGLGIVPSGLNDLVFHHAQPTLDEMTHLFADHATVTLTASLLIFAYRSFSKRTKP
jgi:hypothetical protein